ncbi:MAG: GntR family transcriptional regulator [Micromonosporaceae bacterium]
MTVVDPASSVPPYEQVRRHIAEQIRDGTLPVGARLPTVRQFAAELGLAVNTVARTYRELEAAGLVETRGRSGTFVATRGQHAREEALRAARTYADTVQSLGLPQAEALAIVRAALE